MNRGPAQERLQSLSLYVPTAGEPMRQARCEAPESQLHSCHGLFRDEKIRLLYREVTRWQEPGFANPYWYGVAC